MVALKFIRVFFFGLLTLACMLPFEKANAQSAYTKGTYSVRPGAEFDVYTPTTSPFGNARPVLIFIHGGGWTTGTRADLDLWCQYYASLGFVTITTDYRLAPQHPWPAQYEDVRDLVYLIRQFAPYLKADPNRVAAIGFSAGAHLAGLLGNVEFKNGTLSSKVNRVVTIAAPWDLVDPVANPGKYPDPVATLGTIYALFGQTQPSVSQLTIASPYHHISGASAKTLMFHGVNDTLVPSFQSTASCNKLNSKGVNCNLVLMPNTGHGLPTDISVIVNPLNQFLFNWVSSPN